MNQEKLHKKTEGVAAQAAAPFANGDSPEVILGKDGSEAPAPAPFTPESEVSESCNSTTVVVVSRPGLEKETELALRSLVAFLDGCFKFILIGVGLTPEALKAVGNDKVVNIPFQFYGDFLGDERELLKFITACDEVSDKFIYVPPMCWLCDGIGLHHIQLAKHVGPLNADCETYRALMADDFPFSPMNYRTGYPVWLDKRYLIDAFDYAADRPVDILTIYGNQLSSIAHPIQVKLEDEWGLNVKSADVSETTFARYITGKCFLRTELDHMPPLLEEFMRGLLA